jgi:hypothetical protein
MGFLHPNQPLANTCLDGTNMTLILALPFRALGSRLLQCAIGSTTDGLSGPKFAKLNIQSTNSFYPAVAHDAGYRDTLEESTDNGLTWAQVTLTKQQCDSMLLELCVDNGVPPDEARMIYVAVDEFGQSSFDADRKVAKPRAYAEATA